ncbi:MAG: hypothetical protein RL596_2561 [Bacteroidota bacterium]
MTLKKTITIFMLAVLLFTWGGYRLLTNYLEERAEIAMQEALYDNQYEEANLLYVKIPMSLPYGTSSKEFETVNGSIEVNGITYNYVKRRFYQDYLELYYTPNIEKTNIRNARDEFFRLANDFTADHSSAKKTNNSHPSITKLSLSDFTDDHAFSWQFRCDALENIWHVTNYALKGEDHRSLLERPPQA